MIPNYGMFSESADFGKFSVLRNQLDLIWQWLDKNNRCKINYDAQLTKLEQEIPDPEAFDFFGVFPALDSAMALTSLLQMMQDKESESTEIVSRLSINSVSFYVELSLSQEQEEVTDEEVEEHPLMEWELEMQQELFQAVLDNNETKATCLKLKAIALEEGLSNLGIEIN